MEELEKQLLQSQIEVQEATLNTISKELHDNVGQLLSSSKMQLGVAQRNHQNAEAAIKNADILIGNAINAIRHIAKMYNEDWIKQFSLIENLQEEVNRNNELNELKIHFSHPETLNMAHGDQIILFRIIQEGIQNALKHAQATNIFIDIKEAAKTLMIIITDNGIGFDMDKKQNHGLGINNIKSRTQSLGGTVKWNSSETGTEMLVILNIK